MDLKFVAEQPQRLNLGYSEDILGKGNLQPFSVSNSGVRNQMFSTHNSQKIPIVAPEVPIISTGYENKYGVLSSNFIVAEHDFHVIAKIPKFSRHPDHIYFMIYQDAETREVNVFTRMPYFYITEVYGYLKNNDVLDMTKPGGIIHKNSVLTKSTQYDECNNRMDGLNLLTVYMATDKTKEDSIILSESAAARMGTHCFHKVEITINDNDDPLNMYGVNGVYKVIPDILEHTKDKLLCALRRRKKDDALYTQSAEHMNMIMFNDESFIAAGQVIDLNIHCNNPERLGTTTYDAQLKYYYDERMRVNRDICAIVDALKDQFTQRGEPLVLGTDLEQMYYDAQRELNLTQFKNSDNSTFSNIHLEIMVYEAAPMWVGDKMSNRYGGKGVVSTVVPDAQMPMTEDGRIIDIIQNKNTVIGRENPGQLWEMELNNISHAIISAIRDDWFTHDECLELYFKFVDMVSSSFSVFLRKEYENILDLKSYQELEGLVNSIMSDDYIYLSVAPIDDNMTIDKLEMLYDEFPMARARRLITPIKDSMGNIRYVPSRRALICGPIYYYRLKQIGEEKFSATSLSATNLKGENSKSKLAKLGKDICKATPVKLGDMEISELLHLGVEPTIVATLLYANSPAARRRCQALLTGDPYNPSITLDRCSSNRGAEIFGTYMKTKGLRLEYLRIKKPTINPIVEEGQLINPIVEEIVERPMSAKPTYRYEDDNWALS